MARTTLLPAALLTLLAGGTLAQEVPLQTVDGLASNGGFGQVMARAGDLDGDGTDDVLVGAPKADIVGDREGQLVALSGANLSLLFSIDGSDDLHELGTSLDGLGDVDGDGVPDLVVGEPWPYSDSVVSAPSHAYICSGVDGSVIHTLTGTTIGDEFGHAVAGLGDIDGDGIDDVAVSAPDLIEGNDIHGRVALFSGATGAHLFDVPQLEPGLMYGQALAATPDRDGDGITDLLIGVERWKGPNPFGVGAVFWVSGVDGSMIELFEGGPYVQHQSGNFGRSLGLLGDVDGDGQADVWGGAQEQIRIWSGADGSQLRDIECETENWDRPKLADLGDLDGDGRDEYLLADPEAWGVEHFSGHARAYDAATGEQLSFHRGVDGYSKQGSSVLVLGDDDGDGRPEYLLGVPGHGGFGIGSIALFEYQPQERLLFVNDDDPAFTLFGSDVRSAGDVDNDGAEDVLVGEPFDSTAGNSAGRARVFSGRDGSVLLTLFGDNAVDRLGWAVDGLGDLDGDGHDDLAVGLPFRQPPLAGAVRVVSGASGALLYELEGASAIDRFGQSLAGVGDLDGDGVPDLAVSAPYDDTTFQDAGAVRLYSGVDGTLIDTLFGDGAFLFLGQSVAGGGDVDGDGTPDVVASAPGLFDGGTQTGGARIFSGADGSLLTTVYAENYADSFGYEGTSMALVDDLSGDGLADLVVGAHTQGGGSNPKGRVYVFSGLGGAPLWTYGDGTLQGAYIGQSVAGYPDVDGDGRGEVLVGVPGAFLTDAWQGEARLLSGADGSFLAGYPGFTSDLEEGSSVDTVGDRDFDGWPEVLMAGNNADSIDGAFSIWRGSDPTSPWEDLGGRLPGAAGTPILTPLGSLEGGSFAGVDLVGAPAFAATTLVIGLSQLSLPFKGGVLVPAADILLAGLSTDGAGELLGLGGTWPAGVPAGIDSFYQAWFVDGGGPVGLSATQGVRGTTP